MRYDVWAMNNDWRSRLLEAIDRSTLSDRQVGIASGLGASWVSDFKNGGKAPKVDTFITVCDTLGVSPTYILTGLDLTQEIEDIVRVFIDLPAERRRRLLDLVRAL